MHWADIGNEFWIEDQRLQRFSCFSMDGEYLGSRSYGLQRREWGSFFFDLGEYRFLGFQRGSSAENIQTKFAFIDSELNWVKDFIEVPPQTMQEIGGGGRVGVPYTSTAGVRVCPDGRLLSYLPYQGRVTIYSGDGAPLLHVERDWEYPPVTAQDKERILSRFRDSQNATQLEIADKLKLPDRRAAFATVHADDNGWLWVVRSKPVYESDEVVGHVYDLFDSEGIWIGTQELAYIPIFIQGGFIYRTFTAESGAPRIERIRLEPLIPDIARN